MHNEHNTEEEAEKGGKEEKKHYQMHDMRGTAIAHQKL